MSRLVLPDGALVALTWAIPHEPGGLTKSLLRRSSQLAAASGREVMVVTLAAQRNLAEERGLLRERGLMAEGVSVLNLWEDLAAADDDIWDGAGFDPGIGEPWLQGPGDDIDEILRPDGSLLARQQWQTLGETSKLTRHGDEVVRTEIWDRTGRFRGGWHGVWPLWLWWLDRVIPRPAHMIVDSPIVADCCAAAPLAGVPTTYVVHNGHVAGSREAPYGRLQRWRSFTIARAHRFDAVVHLTHAQRRHVDLLLGPQDNAHVVPHGIETAPSKTKRKRPAGDGIVMANLVARKRITHAVRAVAAAARAGAPAQLTIYGRGPEREALLAEIDEHDAPARLAGYTSDPAGAFAEASYLLLTSRREGFGLVLVEAMSAGCLPIAYDIDYGPADIITNGVNGFLVPRGDEDALAARIIEVATGSRRRLRRMRKAARRRAADFLPGAVIGDWAEVLAAAARRAETRAKTLAPTLDEVRSLERAAGLHRFAVTHLQADITGARWDDRAGATIDLSCSIVGSDDVPGDPEFEVELVHRPTGARAPRPSVATVGVDRSGERPVTQLRLTIDPSTIRQAADHVLLIRARLGDIDVLDTPQPIDDDPDRNSLPVLSMVLPGGRAARGDLVATLVRGRRGLRSVRLEVSVELPHGAHGRPDLVLQLRDRRSGARTEVPLVGRAADDPDERQPQRERQATVWVGSATIPRSMLRRGKETVIQAHVTRTLDGRQTRSRVRVTDTSKLPRRTRTIEPFATKRGNLRFRVRPGRLRRWGSSLLRRGWRPRRRPAAKP